MAKSKMICPFCESERDEPQVYGREHSCACGAIYYLVLTKSLRDEIKKALEGGEVSFIEDGGSSVIFYTKA